ncbi:MAG: Hsp70 family protein, partial [Flavobacteriales bacterium]|nr:Hsp70 family protein [Flavobacteriales bacterium]
ILNVSAKDKATGKEQNIKIEASSGLSDEEIEKMKQEAEANSDADNKAKETADKINAADGMIFQTEKQIKEFGEKLSDDKKVPIEEALVELKSAHESKDLDAIDSAMEKINTAWTAASEEMYKASQEEGANPAEGEQSENTTDDVTDVEFEEVKEEDGK